MFYYVLSFVLDSLSEAVKKQQMSYFSSEVNEQNGPKGVVRSSDAAQLGDVSGGKHNDKVVIKSSLKTATIPVVTSTLTKRVPLADIINKPDADKFSYVAGKLTYVYVK